MLAMSSANIVYAMPGFEIVVAVIVLVAAAIRGAVNLMRSWLFKRAARKWPLVDATVEFSYTIPCRYSLTASCFPILGYSYKIDGQSYSGSIGLRGSRSRSKVAAQEIGNTWRGTHLAVRVDPKRPERSAFLQEDGAPPHVVNYPDQQPTLEVEDAEEDVMTLSLGSRHEE